MILFVFLHPETHEGSDTVCIPETRAVILFVFLRPETHEGSDTVCIPAS